MSRVLTIVSPRYLLLLQNYSLPAFIAFLALSYIAQNLVAILSNFPTFSVAWLKKGCFFIEFKNALTAVFFAASFPTARIRPFLFFVPGFCWPVVRLAIIRCFQGDSVATAPVVRNRIRCR